MTDSPAEAANAADHGIYRPVTLVCLPKRHIIPESIAVRTLDYKARKIRVDFQTHVTPPPDAGHDTSDKSDKLSR